MLARDYVGEQEGAATTRQDIPRPFSRIASTRTPRWRSAPGGRVAVWAAVAFLALFSVQGTASASLAGDLISAEVIWEPVQEDWPPGYNELIPAGTTAIVDLAPSTPEYDIPFFGLGGSSFEIDFFDGPLIGGSTNALSIYVDFADFGAWPIPDTFQVTLTDLDFSPPSQITSVVKVSGEPDVLEVIAFSDDSITLSMDSEVLVGGTGFEVEYRYTFAEDTTSTIGPITASNVFITPSCFPGCDPSDFPIDWGTIRTFNYTVPPGRQVVDAVVSGTWGDGSPFDSSAPVELYLDGVLVAECVQFALCWLDDGQLVDWSFGFAANAVPGIDTLFGDGQANLTAVQNDEISVILSNLELVLTTESAIPPTQAIVRFVDTVGDHGAPVDIDLVALYLSFDPATGDYEALWVADPANPFNGTFRLNTNLFNPDTGTSAQDPAFFQDTLNDYTLATPQETMLLTGNNPRLTAWAVGDEVAVTCPAPLGCPTNTFGFASAVAPIGGSFGFDSFDTGSSVIRLPEPNGFLALVLGMLGLSALERRRRMRRNA